MSVPGVKACSERGLMLMHREAYHASGLSRPRVILTIHNMDNSGECRQEEFAYCGTSRAFLTPLLLPGSCVRAAQH